MVNLMIGFTHKVESFLTTSLSFNTGAGIYDAPISSQWTRCGPDDNRAVTNLLSLPSSWQVSIDCIIKSKKESVGRLGRVMRTYNRRGTKCNTSRMRQLQRSSRRNWLLWNTETGSSEIKESDLHVLACGVGVIDSLWFCVGFLQWFPCYGVTRVCHLNVNDCPVYDWA